MFVRLDNQTLRRSLRAGIVDGSTYSIMVGLGETYFPAFVLALGHGEVAAGLTATVPMLAGSILQLASPPLARRARSYRWWTVGAAAAQALCFLPLMFAALHGRFPWIGVLLLVTWYWAGGLSANPTWNAWMARIIPPDVRARYFAVRTPITQVFLFLGLLAGGAVLERFAGTGSSLRGFALLFAIAGVARLISSAFLWAQAEPGRTTVVETGTSPWGLFKLAHTPESRIIIYMLIVQAATQLATPFFTPYMLHHLRLPYLQYVILLAVAYLARVVMSPTFGRWAHRYGTKRLLWVGGIAVVPVGLLWMPYSGFGYLLVVQFLTGTAFAAYELATLLLLLEALPSERRTGILTTYNFLNAVATVGGSLAGGAVLAFANEGHSAYMWVFALSSAARLASLPLLRGILGGTLWRTPPAVRVPLDVSSPSGS